MTTVNIISMLKGLREAGCRITTICKCKGYVIGERAKRARHSLENRIYIMVRANFVLITRKLKKAERNFEIAAGTLCLRVRRYASLYSSGKNPASLATFQF